jgi:beta-galactosidase
MKIFYGAQYYRPPTPPEKFWEKDFMNMKNARFNILKFWPMWRWHNPEQGKYNWDDLDKLMKLSEKYGFKVILNIILDTAPAWFIQKYPDCRIINARGIPLQPVDDGSRQIGGYNVVCCHHPEYKKETEEFIRQLVLRYKESPALYVWDLWNEPWIPGGWFKDKPEDTVCYCQYTRKEFISWLKDKYQDIHNLNKCWARTYTDFDEIEIPNSCGLFSPVCDFRIFMMHTVRMEMRRRAQIVKSIDTEHKTMSHSGICCVISSPISMGNDDWLLSAELDFYGGSTSAPFREGWEKGKNMFNYEMVPIELDGLRSAAGGKDIWSSEFQVYCNKWTFGSNGPIEKKHLERWVSQLLGQGLSKGIVYWQYHTELLGYESPGGGIPEPDGSPNKDYYNVVDIGKMLEKYDEKILNAKPPKNDVALVYNPDAYIMSWTAKEYFNRNYDMIKSVRGFYRALYANSIGCDFVHSKFNPEKMFDYKVIILPLPFTIDETFDTRLIEYVEKGGTLISEAKLGAIRREDGMHSLHIPGYSLVDVFGCKEVFWDTFPGKIKININGKNEITGHIMKEVFEVTTGEVIGKFSKNEPCIIYNKFGRGQTIIFGSFIGQAIIEYNAEKDMKYLSELLFKFGIQKKLEFKASGIIHGDILNGDGYDILIFINNENKKNNVRFMDYKKYTEFEDMYTGNKLKNTMLRQFTVESYGCRMFLGYL